MKKKLLQEKLMKVIPVRLNEELEKQITEVSTAVGESKQTVIRLAIKKGLKHALELLDDEQKKR